MFYLETANKFFDQDFLKDIISALIGTGTALLVFYLKIISDREKEKKKIKETNKNRVRHFSNLVKSSINHVKIITSNLDKMVSDYEQDNLRFQLLRFSPNQSFERLEELLKSENYFLSYISIYGENKIETFNNISSEVDYFNLQIDQLWSMVQRSQKFDFERKKMFKAQVNELMNLTASFTKQVNLFKSEDIEKLNSIIINFHKNITDESDLNYFYKFIRTVLEKVLINYTNNSKVLEHLPKYREASVLFREIKLQNVNHSKELKQISEAFNKTLEKYKKDASELIL